MFGLPTLLLPTLLSTLLRLFSSQLSSTLCTTSGLLLVPIGHSKNARQLSQSLPFHTFCNWSYWTAIDH
ncbi:hypothetical protein SLEP1_g47578 [Rubroshorea leprosula]|uniref:Secreted protein n=1 Tax=Rubroshorea leprosula TaxID=152421 RepID=A0AAV5LQY9_9ROSI|nr:hypothetical protein SLEP1_g47578 [Rubroshorea leprosula]